MLLIVHSYFAICRLHITVFAINPSKTRVGIPLNITDVCNSQGHHIYIGFHQCLFWSSEISVLSR